jgi:O-antigen/teichoic acid export membrane protein
MGLPPNEKPSSKSRLFPYLLDNLSLGQLSRKTAIVGSSKVVQFIGVLGTNVLLTRIFLVSEFGRYQQSWLLINTLVPVLLLGIPQGINFLLPRSDAETSRKILWLFYGLLTAVSLPIAVLLVIFPHLPAAAMGNPQLVPILRVVGIYLIIVLPTYCLDPLLIIHNRQVVLLVTTAIYGVLFFGVNAFFGFYRSIELIFVGLSVIAAMKMCFTLWLTARLYGGWHKTFDPALLKQIISYVVVLGAIGAVDVVSLNIDKYLVACLRAESLYAIYSIGAMELPIIAILLASVSAVVMPEFSRLLKQQDTTGAIALLHNSMRKLAMFIFPVFTYLLVTAYIFIPLLFTTRYKESVAIFCIYLFLLPLRVANNHPLLIAAGLQRYALIGRVIDVTVNLILGLVLLHFIGIWGPAISTVLATYVHKMYQTAIVMEKFHLALPRVYPWATFTRWLGLSVVCTLIVVCANLLLPSYLVSLPLGTALFVLTYGWFLFRSGR